MIEYWKLHYYISALLLTKHNDYILDNIQFVIIIIFSYFANVAFLFDPFLPCDFCFTILETALPTCSKLVFLEHI